MGRENRYMLFVPPSPPLRLDPEREAVIGRSRGCELTLAGGPGLSPSRGGALRG